MEIGFTNYPILKGQLKIFRQNEANKLLETFPLFRFCFPKQVEMGHVLHMNNNLVITPTRSQMLLVSNVLSNYVVNVVKMNFL